MPTRALKISATFFGNINTLKANIFTFKNGKIKNKKHKET
jgi:hypothetical protein